MINHLSMEDCHSQCTGGCLAVTSSVLYNAGDGFWNPNTDSLLLARQESDITWTTQVNWEDYRDWPPCLGFDLWGVSTHEMGHFFGIGHSAFGTATMFASIASCDSTKASLSTDDKRAYRVLHRDGVEIAVATLEAGAAKLSVTNKGNLGFTGPGGKWGDSFQFDATGTAEHLFECSFAMAEAGGPVSDNFRQDVTADPGGDADFLQVTDLAVSRGVTSQEAQAQFDDSRAEAPYGVRVVSRFFADDAAGNEDFVIAEYLLINESGQALTDFRGGLFADVDYNNEYIQNSVSYEADRSLAVVSTPNTGNLFGITVCNSEGAAAMRALYATDQTAPEEFSDANKETWMGAAFERTTLGPADIALMIATGDFDVLDGDTVNVAFAIVGGTSLADLRANALTAQIFYQTVIKGSVTGVEDARIVLPVARMEPVSPNPFSGSTRLSYSLLASGPARLDVIDASGRVVRTLVQEQQDKGHHSVVWDGRDHGGNRVASGVYFSRLRTGGVNLQEKMLILK
jgi:hypothetical protein